MIKIVIDSASNIDQEEAEKLGIVLLPMEVRFGDKTYFDGVDLKHRQFFEMLIESAEFPKTSQINEFRFEDCFSKMTKDGDEVIAIVVSSKLSGTFNSAKSAAQKFGGNVHVVDSLNACIGERILCQLAVRLVEKGMTAQQIVDELNEKKKKIQLLAVLDTLKFLKKGGRISTVAAFMGETFSIKPVISITGGEVKLVGKAMGSKRGNNLLMQLVDKCGGIDFDMPYAVAYSGLSDEFLQKYLKDSHQLWEGKTNKVPSYLIGSTIGTYAGPNAIAVSFFAK